jgi:cell division transport system permease protein
MSGSSRDWPTGPTRPPYARPDYTHRDPYTEPYSDPPALQTIRRDEAPVAEAPPDDGRDGAGEPNVAAIVPAGSVTSRSLTMVVSIMCFLACLAAGAAYMINRTAATWLRDLASEITIQVEPVETGETDKLVREVATFLSVQPGVLKVKPLGAEASTALLEPWLGQTDALKSLPVPQLIALEIDSTPSRQPDLDALRILLSKQFKGVALDDHRRWQQQIRTVTRSFGLGGFAILMLVGAATTAIIVSATSSAMASNREIVEVLHLVGATDRFIAREFSRHFLRLGIRAGLVGAVFAMATFLLMPTFMEVLGGGTVTMTEVHRLIGSGTLDAGGYVLMILVVIVIAALCMLTSRIRVYRILHERP